MKTLILDLVTWKDRKAEAQKLLFTDVATVYSNTSLSVREIARLFCIDQKLVNRAVRSNGIPFRSPGIGSPAGKQYLRKNGGRVIWLPKGKKK